MFGFSTGRAAYPTIYTVSQVRKGSKKDPSSPPKEQPPPSKDSLEPAIDGPPSPERIRAYTEQMKRSSIFGNNSRTNTLSSATSSFRSRESTSTSTDNLSLSRKSSSRSNASSMPSSKSDRPESVQIFGSIFSRGSRKLRRENSAISSSRSSVTVGEISDEGSAKDHYYGRANSFRRSPPLAQDARKRQLISGPYNFQHVTHTRQDHLPNLERASGVELVSEFSAIRASQAPTNGELKGIRVQELTGVRGQDLHFENFSSETLNAPPTAEDSGLRPLTSPEKHRRSVLRKPFSPIQPQQQMSYAKSYDNLSTVRRSPPPRPPRSPLPLTCPMALPARTSSRTASVLFDTFDPLATTTIERPQIKGGFRKPAPFGLPPAPPPPPTWSEQQEYFSDRPMSHALTTPGDEAWPLTAGVNFGGELADVQEEEEDYVGSRRSRLSTTSGELRLSQSVPALRMRAQSQAGERPETRMSTTLGRTPSNGTTVARKSPLSPSFQFTNESWEDDIDFMYEHEAEADCDYQWDRCSVGEGPIVQAIPSTQVQPVLDLHLEDDDRSVYHGRFRPSLLVPSAFDPPELSPMSNTSTTASPDPRTPSNFLRPGHAHSLSQASSFKESHGFTLSPTLLIPSDFHSQMEQDALYDEHLRNNAASATIFTQEPYTHSVSPVDESTSSTASFRSSNFSRGSARSSSSTRISTANSNGSQDSVVLLQRAASLSQAHRSIGSASSLPDLVPSAIRRSENIHENDLASSIGALNMSESDDSAPAPEVTAAANSLTSLQHRRNKSFVLEQGLRKGVNHFAPPTLTLPKMDVLDGNGLSPVAESFVDSPREGLGQVHGRKISAPVVSPSVKEFKGRARAATSVAASTWVSGKKRGSYMLFPQV
jgi:hypothetical protein